MLNHHSAHLTTRLWKYQTEICRRCGVRMAVAFAFGICHFVIPSAFDIRASSLSTTRARAGA
jgi:hypothetical protein